MKRTLFVLVSGAVLLVCLGLFFLWADAGPRPEADLTQRTSYPTPLPPSTQDTFTVATYNLGHLAEGGDSPPSSPAAPSVLQRVEALLRQTNADFIGLQEVDFGRSSSVLDSMALHLGMKGTASAVRWNDRYSPYAPRLGPIVSGQAVWSRFPIRQHVRTRMTDSSQAFWERWLRPDPVVHTTVIDIGGWPLFIMNVNLDAPAVATREQHAREVNRLYLRLSSLGMPVLIVGSIDGPMSSASPLASNGEPTSSDNDTVEFLLRGTSLQPAFFAEGARVTGQSVATHPADTPRRKVDYIFYRPGRIAPTDANIRCGASPPPSDHCAVTLSFLLPRPLDRLPDTRIPDAQLPSLDSLLHTPLDE